MEVVSDDVMAILSRCARLETKLHKPDLQHFVGIVFIDLDIESQERASWLGFDNSAQSASVGDGFPTLPVVKMKTLGVTVCTAQHSTAQHSTAEYSTVQYSTAQHSTARHSTVQHSTVQYTTVHYSTAQHSRVQQSTENHSTAQHSTVSNRAQS